MRPSAQVGQIEPDAQWQQVAPASVFVRLSQVVVGRRLTATCRRRTCRIPSCTQSRACRQVMGRWWCSRMRHLPRSPCALQVSRKKARPCRCQCFRPAQPQKYVHTRQVVVFTWAGSSRGGWRELKLSWLGELGQHCPLTTTDVGEALPLSSSNSLRLLRQLLRSSSSPAQRTAASRTQ